jgi:phenylacetate-CoA ligase
MDCISRRAGCRARMIDPEGERSLTDGAGELVYASHERGATPVPIAPVTWCVSGTGPCACGRSTFRFPVLGRSDDMLHVRGINVFPGGVGNVLAHLTDRFSGEFQILVDHPPPHQSLHIRVELIQGFARAGGRSGAAGRPCSA